MEDCRRLVRQADSAQECHAHRGAQVNKGNVAPVYCIPARDVPVDGGAQSGNAVQVTKVGDEEAEEQGAPDAQIGGSAQDNGLIEGEQQVQICQLGKDYLGANGHALGACAAGWHGSRRTVRQLEIDCRVEVRVVAADEGAERLQVQEEKSVRRRQAQGVGPRHCWNAAGLGGQKATDSSGAGGEQRRRGSGAGAAESADLRARRMWVVRGRGAGAGGGAASWCWSWAGGGETATSARNEERRGQASSRRRPLHDVRNGGRQDGQTG